MKKKLKNVSHIFIDFDGTLVDTVPMLFHNYLSFLRHFNIEGTEGEFQELMGPSIKEFIPLLSKKYQLKLPLDQLYQLYIKELPLSYSYVKYMPGAVLFLEFAKKNNLLLSLVTSTPKSLLECCMVPLKLKDYFSVILTSDDVKKTKPSPEIYLLALKQNQINNNQAITIEDSFNGITASRNAHIETIALQDKKNENLFEDVLYLKNWNEILEFFKRCL